MTGNGTTDTSFLLPALHWFQSCDFCASQEGSHYCLLHSCEVKNMDLLFEQSREFPMIAGNTMTKTELLGMQVVVDWSSPSRVTVVEGFTHQSWRRRKKRVKS